MVRDKSRLGLGLELVIVEILGRRNNGLSEYLHVTVRDKQIMSTNISVAMQMRPTNKLTPLNAGTVRRYQIKSRKLLWIHEKH